MTGPPVSGGQGQSDSDFLSLANIIEKQQPNTTELANRPGIALSEAGCTLGMGKELLDKCAADPATTGEKLGVQGVADLLKTEAGKAFVAAAATFNKNDEAPKNAGALQAAAGKWMDFLLDDPKGKARAAQRLVKSAARSYLLGMELLQWLAAAKNLSQWAGNLKKTKTLQVEKVQKWIQQPSDKTRLIAALVAAYEDPIDTQPKRSGQALSGSEASSPAEPASEGGGADSSGKDSSSADSSSSSDDKKKKDKKNKKKGKSTKDKKKSKKEDKDKKDKKKNKKSNSSSKQGSKTASPSTRRKRKAVPAAAENEEDK